MSGTVKWNGAAWSEAFSAGLTRNLNRAGTVLMRAIKQAISRPGRRNRRGRDAALASAPGEPPLKQTGRLFRSVRKRMAGRKKLANGRLGRGTSVRIYAAGRLMEEGSVNMRARPFLKPTYEKNRNEIRQIMLTPVKPRTTIR